MNGYQHLGVQQPQRPERQSSPLRVKDLTAKAGGNLRLSQGPNIKNEEDEYEKRRQEEIRKQVQQKEYESLQKSQPARSNYNSNDKYASGKSYQSIPEKEYSSSNHFTLGPKVNQEPSYEAPPHVKEHLANIQSDNSSLMRRLNLVIQELDRVNREKEEIYQRLKSSAKESSDLQKLINGDDNVDKVNNYMSDDLVYERDRNHKVKSQIKELDLYRTELIHELRKIQDRQEDIAKENQQLTHTLQHKLNAIQDTEKEHYFTQEKIKQVNHAIEQQKLILMDDQSDKGQLQKILSQLIIERNDLLSRLEHLTEKYDECVKEISHDRSEMEQHNKQHAKLITAKIIFQQLEQIQKSRIATGFQEFRQYCNFDKKCHNKLTNFSKVLEKIGHFSMRKNLRHWFVNALKPLQTKKQSQILAAKTNDTQSQQRMFILWKELYDKKIQQYDLKTKAVSKIWDIQQKDTLTEQKRAFKIWREVIEKFKLKQNRVKKLIWKLYFNKLNIAMNTWMNHSSSIDTQVRLNLLSKEFSQKQYLTVLFHNFKYQITENKRKRFNILFHCMKSWKDYLAYQKFLMGSNVAALTFKKTCDSTILKQCFDALREHKELQKFQRLNHLLNEEELPLIEKLTNETEDFEIQRKFKAKSKACESVKLMMSKQLYGYFLHWKKINENYQEKLRTTVKDKIIKAYMAQIRKSFTYWKSLHGGNKIQSQSMIINDYQHEQATLQNEVLDLKKEVLLKNQSKDCSQQKNVLKCVTSYQKRMVQLAMGRWRDQIADMNFKEDGASTIIKRLRMRFLRQAFDLYVAGVKYKKKLLIEEERCALYHRTRNERLKKVVMNSWIIFSQNHKTAKKYWYRMYLRLDIGQKQLAMKKWKEWVQQCSEQQLLQQQNEVVNTIENLNHQIGNLHQEETSKQMEIQSMKKQLTKQAQRIISNAFARFYYVSETRGFEKWKEYVNFEKNKERLLKKTLNHWKKYQFYFVKSCFQNWIQNSNIRQKKEQIKKEDMKVEESTFQLDLQTKLFTSMRSKLANELQEVKRLQDIYNSRLQKSVQMIISKVDNNNYMSQKRFILLQWRDYVKREVQFIKCTENVIKKSLWSQAFLEMRQFSREKRNDAHKEAVLNRFRLKFWNRTCSNAFSKWRSGAFTMISQTVEEVDMEYSNVVEDHQNKKAVFKEVNVNRSERIIKKHNLKNIFQSWKNVTQFLKHQNSKNEHFELSTQVFQKKMAIWKWKSRKNATKLARLRSKRLREKFYRIRLRQYFFALRNQFLITKDFCQRMSNLASIHDHQGLKISFNAITSFAKSKQFVHETKKSNASKDIESILTSLVQRRKQQYLNDLRLRTLDSKKKAMIKSFTILQSIGNKLRFFFQKWKEESNEKSLAKEMHEEGPIREEVFEARAQLKNLQNFLAQEGYDKKDVQEAIKNEKQRHQYLLLKGVRRMQHYNEELYGKPKVFDRWREYVQARKLYKYWLGQVAKRGEYIKSDLHHAFDQWKNYHTKQEENLRKLSKKQLDQRLLKNNKELDKIADDVQDKENEQDNLINQREALVENYVKGQKLAFSLWINYRKKCLHQGFLRWCKAVKTAKNTESLNNLRKNLELLENLKDKIGNYEEENEALANENEDLRQFSLDGYEIAKNVQTLTGEREKLSVDLADKAQVIRKLLDENDRLTAKLRVAQEEAQNLIKSTMGGSSGFKNPMKGKSSPMANSFY